MYGFIVGPCLLRRVAHPLLAALLPPFHTMTSHLPFLWALAEHVPQGRVISELEEAILLFLPNAVFELL